MAVAGSDQGVGDLVQEGVQDLLRPVSLDQMGRQLDGATVVHAQAERSLAAVVGAGPAVQAVCGKESEDDLADLP
jgi:hypothetical protein